MINWNIFDKIYCIHYLPYKERFNDIKSELSRIGLLNSSNFEFYYTVPNKYYDFLFWDKNIQSHLNLQYLNITNINYSINSYNLMCIINRMKYKRVLIIEDDVKFLNQIKNINKILNYFPSNYDIVNFEPYIWCESKDYQNEYEDILNNEYTINNFYINISKNRRIYDTGCIAFSDNFIEYYLDKQDDSFSPFDYYACSSDEVKFCIPKIPLCIQKLYTLRQNYCCDCDDKYPWLNKELYK